MNYFVTGGAGFIGSNLVDRLLADGHRVTAYDNFSTGQRPFLADAAKNPRFALVEGDLLDLPALTRAVAGHDFVFHLAANADIRDGWKHPERDLQQNTVATFNVLEAMRANGVKRIAFSSTGSVYGEAAVIPTPEDAPFPIQTSLYAASKLAGEGLIGAYAHGFGFTGVVFRFGSILGERYTHGHVYDFFHALRADPTKLRVLGNGQQRKSYLYVRDCVSGILTALDAAGPGLEVYNLGTDESIVVDESIATICAYLGVDPVLEHTGGIRGWAGDSPLIHLDTTKIRSLGWEPTVNIREAVVKTLEWLSE